MIVRKSETLCFSLRNTVFLSQKQSVSITSTMQKHYVSQICLRPKQGKNAILVYAKPI